MQTENQTESRLGNDQEVAQGIACSDCRHILNEDHDENNCYGLDFNGSAWVACKCKRFKSGFDIKVAIYESTSKKAQQQSESNSK